MDLERLKREWIQPANRGEDTDAGMWDSRAGEFAKKPIPDRRENLFLKYIWQRLQPGPETKVLDIGCGAGQYSLALAQTAGHVTGTDVSPKMIEAARRSAAETGADNVEFLTLDWADADIDRLGWRGKYDLVFAHMTPAVCDYHTLEMMNSCAAGHCFIVKPVRRRDSVLDGALRAAGLDGRRRRDDMIPNIFAYLWLNGYTPEIIAGDAEWTSERSARDMIDWCIFRQSSNSRRELSAQEKAAIEDYIMDKSVDGIVTEEISAQIVTIYWNVKERYGHE